MTVAALAAEAQSRRRWWRRRHSAPDGRVNFVGPQHDELAARRDGRAAPARPGERHVSRGPLRPHVFPNFTGRRDRLAPADRRVFAGRRAAAAFGAGVTALAAAAVLLAGAGPAGPSVASAAQLALAPATGAAPGVTADNRRLTASVDGIAYPYWGDGAGWEAVATRRDDLGGRKVMTVVYANARKQRIGYAISSGTPLTVRDATTVTRHGAAFRVLRADGATIVTWLRDGHTCILAARGVGTSVLLDLASWRA
jgi:hypothetical protein